MRVLLGSLLVAGVALLAFEPPDAAARPEFARREGKACGYCHINPNGGGPRNQRGLAYARAEFSFPPRRGDLSSFSRERDRAAMVRAEKLVDQDHTDAAVEQLRRLRRRVDDPAARRLIDARLHELEVRGSEILGRARLLVRGEDPDEGIALLVVLVHEFGELEVHDQAREDLRELARDPEHKERIRREKAEAKARLDYLEAVEYRVDGREEKARWALERVVERHPGTRAAARAREELGLPEKGEQGEDAESGREAAR